MSPLDLPYDPKGFPDEDEELRLVKQACLDAFGSCGEEVPVELLRGLRYQRAAVVGRMHLTKMAATAARVRKDDRRLVSMGERISELERKRAASGKQIVDMHRKLAKLKVRLKREESKTCSSTSGSSRGVSSAPLNVGGVLDDR